MRRLLSILSILLCLTGRADGNHRRHLTVADGLLNNQVCQLVELPNGQVLVGTEWMFNLYNGQEFVPQECNLDSLYPLPAFGYHSHLWQGDSLLWLKDFHWLYLYDARTRRFRYDYTHRLGEQQVSRFIHERGDSLSKASVEGLHAMRPPLDSLTRGTSLQGQWLTAYLQDRQGGQWFGLQHAGILYVSPEGPVAECLTVCPDEEIRCLMPLDSVHCLMGTSAGIHIYDTDRRRITASLLKGDIGCTDMARDARGHIWVSTKRGLYRYDGAGLKCYDTSNVPGFLHPHIRFTLPLDDDRLLVCNLLHHLGYFYPDENRFERLTEKLPRLQQFRTMSAACVTDSAHQVVVCTQNGIFLLDVAHHEIREFEALREVLRYSQKFNCVCMDSHKRLWIGTGNGLLVLAEGRVTRLTRREGLSNASVRSIVEDPEGHLWVATSYGINRVTVDHRGEIRILTLREDDGVPAQEQKERGATMMPDGTALFPCVGGLVTFRTDGYDTDSSSPLQVVLTGLDVNGREHVTDTLPLALAHRENSFTLRFSTLNYAAPGKTHYRYRLRGLDTGWLHDHAGEGAVTVRYSALPPGDYTFEASAAVGDGDWGPALSKTITIHPPLWLTWWAKLLYLIIIVITASLLLHIYLKRRRAKMERDNDERVNRLFEIRDEARRQFAHSTRINPSKLAADKEEEELMQRVLNAISQNMGNTDYTVDQLAKDIGMSRANFYKKMQSMLGITPNDFLRNVRLKHAAHLLTETDHTVSQVSLMVGFLTPRYFSQCFKKMFGVLPSEYGSKE